MSVQTSSPHEETLVEFANRWTGTEWVTQPDKPFDVQCPLCHYTQRRNGTAFRFGPRVNQLTCDYCGYWSYD